MNQSLMCIKSFWNQLCTLVWKFLFNAKRWTIILVLPVSMSMTGCFQHYYNTNPMSPIDSAKIEQLVSNKSKYFIMHANGYSYGLTDIRVSEEWLDGKLDSIQTLHAQALDPASTTKNHIDTKYGKEVMDEVHIYAKSSSQYVSPVHIALKDLVRIDVYGEDKKAMKSSRVLGIVLITVGVSAILVGIVALVSSIRVI